MSEVILKDGLARVEDLGARGMITLRGDLSDQTLRDVVTGLTGTDFPDVREAKVHGGRGVLWMSPDELLVMLPHAELEGATRRIAEALSGTHHLVSDVSDARAIFRVAGPAAREVVAKLTPADVAPGVFGPGQVRRTRLSQVAAAFWMTGDDAFEIICFRSVALYMANLLRISAQPGGEVGYF